MSFFSGLEAFFVTVESDVIKTIANIQQGFGAAAHEIQAGLNWVAQQAPAATAAAKQISSVAALVAPEVSAINPGAGAAMTAGVAALNMASNALDAFSAQMAANAGASTAQTDATALLAAYHTLKSSQAATSTLAAAIATPAAAPAVA